MAKGRPNRQKPVHRPAGERGRPAGPASGRRPSGRERPPAGGPSGGRPPSSPAAQARPDAPTLHKASTRDVVYGRNAVRETLRGRRRVRAVFVEEGPQGRERVAEVESWAEMGHQDRGPAAFVPPRVSTLTGLDLSRRLGTLDHQGVGAEVEPYPYVEAEELLQSLDLLVVLDRVQDPHNLGAVVRTAEGAGAGVVIPRHRAVGVTGAVVRAAAGATEHALIAQVRNLTDFLTAAKRVGFWIYGAAAGAPEPYHAPDYRDRTVFVLGSEGEGLARRVQESCDMLVRLPLEGRVQSLNVSVTAGVLLYEALRQRGAAPGE